MAAHHRFLDTESVDAQPDADPEGGAGTEDGWALPEEPLRLRPVPAPAPEPVAAALDDGWGLEPEPISSRRPRPAAAATSTAPPVDKGRFSLQALAGGELGRVDERDFLSDFLRELLGPEPGSDEALDLGRLLQRVRCLIGPR